MMKKIFGKNWRTTLLGYLAATGLVVSDLLASGGAVTGVTLGKAVFVAVVGKIAKDAAETGAEQ